MKLNCDIVQDLLPLYEDCVCSEGSRAAVEEHLRECEACRSLRDGVQAVPEGEIVMDIPAEEKQVVGSFKKVRRRWAISLIALLLVIPVAWLSFNQVRGAGICFSNWDDILIAKRFVNAIADGKYEKAADMMDFSALYQQIWAVQEITAEDFLGNTERVQIGETVWYMDKFLAEEIGELTNQMEIWSYLILKYQYGVMVPEEAMQAVMAQEGIVQEDTTNGYALSYYNLYSRMETPWGTYLVNDSSYQNFNQGERGNVDYAVYFAMIPEDMYWDILPDIEEYAQQMVAANEALYSGAWDMTEKEFCAYMKEKYVAELEDFFSQGVEISDARYFRAYRQETGWSVDIQVTVTYGDQRQEMYCIPAVSGGSILSIGWGYTGNFDWQDALGEALSPCYYD